MEPGKPLVSIIIPNYNYARTLGICLEAVAAQTYSEIETILVDDGSTDASEDIARAHDVRFLRTPSNGGCGAARNLGVTHARGEILFFLDSDVALHRDAVANAVELLRSDERVSVVCGMYDEVPLIRTGLVKEYRCLQQYHWFAESEGRMRGFNPALCAIRAEVFASVGPFNPRHKQTEEQDYAYRLTSAGHEVRGSLRVRGRHDHDDGARVVLRKVFHRTRLAIPLYALWRGLPGGAATGPRAFAALSALLACVSLPLAIVFGPASGLGPAALVVPAALFATSVLADAGMYRFVWRTRGPALTVFFVGMHFLVNVTVAAGALVGIAQMFGSRDFRISYRRSVAASAPGPNG